MESHDEIKQIKEYTFGISTSKNKLTLRSKTFNLYPQIKFVRKARKKLIARNYIAVYDIKIPFEIISVQRKSSWLGNGFQNDDINCSETWQENVKVYDKVKLKNLIIISFRKHGIVFKGNAVQHY